MAKKRMFSQQITESDSFTSMPLSSQALYFHLSLNADDDGFINSPKRVQRMIGASDDDLNLLIVKKFLIPFDSGVVVVKHWRINNYIRSDRYVPTVYTEEKNQLIEKKNHAYSLKFQQGIPDGIPMVSIDKNRLDKNRLNSSSRGGRVNLLNMLTPEETSALFATYEDADYLIDEVEADINRKMKGAEIDNFYRYVIGYASNKGWLTNEQ